MAIKWSSRSELIKGLTAFAAFVLGVTLALNGLLGIGKLLTSQDSEMEWWRTDWQETTDFKREVSWYLREFLSIGAGGHDLVWYDMNNRMKKQGLLPGSVDAAYTMASEAPTSAGMPAPSGYYAPDAEYQEDQNVLYGISVGWTEYKYSNLSPAHTWETLPDSYNFFLEYRNGKVSITQNGNEIDVYGNGIYDSAEEWFLPGYDNFKAGEDVEDVEVRIAVRQIPVQEYGEGRYSASRMYRIYEEYNQLRNTVLQRAMMLLIGVVLLFFARFFRKERAKVNERVAALTLHIWTEVRAVLFAGFLTYHLFLTGAGIDDWLHDIIYLVFDREQPLAAVTGVLLALWPTTPLFCLVWLLWLICNDHRYNTKETRRGLLQKLRARELKRPVQRRLQRSIIGGLISMGIVILLSIPVILYVLDELWYGWYGWYDPAVLIIGFVCMLDLLLIPLAYTSLKTLRTAKDIGTLTTQIAAIRNGDLSTCFELPADADLHQAAVDLGGIQAGLEKALEDRTQSERMKVELISNVSHDLKTPLTSVLSYATLLEEENLPGAAGDYAHIILEKAKRLDVMVQDVFSISKAASGQLRLTPERLDLGKLLRQTLADMNDAIVKSELTFKTELPSDPVEIIADGERLYRVFQNLIQNALQYSIPGSRVYMALRADAETAQVTVRNVSAEELPPGMDFTARFTRGDESRTDGGAGLGLSIASSFTEACGGTFAVETDADLFTVKVSFPVANQE